MRTNDGAVVYDGDAGAVANDEFTAFGTGAYVSPFFVGAGAGGGSTAVGFTGAGCGVPTLSPTDAECNVGLSNRHGSTGTKRISYSGACPV